jgi:D-lactate dehydrogenase
MAFNSKGFKETALKKAKELEAALKSASNNGEFPILCDTSPCLYFMKTTFDPSLQLLDPIEFALDYLADRLVFTRLPETVALHPVCSAKKMGLDARLVELAEKCAEKVIVPDVTCCGFAGDKGFFQPELNAFGLRNLKKQLPPDTVHGLFHEPDLRDRLKPARRNTLSVHSLPRGPGDTSQGNTPLNPDPRLT